MHTAEKGWLTTHPKSIPLSLFCWVKSIEHAHVTHNHFYPTQKQFVNAILHFLRNTIPEKGKNFRSQVSDNFRIISQQNFQILEWERYRTQKLGIFFSANVTLESSGNSDEVHKHGWPPTEHLRDTGDYDDMGTRTSFCGLRLVSSRTVC